MKKAENNEMELLLRSLARREGNRSFPLERTADLSAHSAHLDADELSSYAERTLPAATRARYTIHLADCARCRKIVAELAPAVSASVRDHPEEQGVTTSWQRFFNLFSLPMLRYAVPALGLFAIVVVGIVVFRQQSPSSLTARNAPMPEQVAVTQNQPTEVPPQEKAAAKADSYSADSAPNLSAERQAKAGEQGQATGASGAVSAPAVVGKEAAVEKEAAIEKDAAADKTAAAAPQPTFAPEPTAPPPPKPQDQIADARKERAAQTEAAARQQSDRPAKQPEVRTDNLERHAENRAEEKRGRDKAEKGEGQAAVTVSSGTARDRGALIGQRKAQTLRTDTAGNKADDETVETRTVAGRRFRRQGGLWVDTAYHSGLSLTTVSRGSEQYRALVADEPSIRTVAEQLQGEVILVWKSRGYRIR